MKNAAELLVGAIARALADNARVMLAGDSFELLQVLAQAPVKELVVVSPLVSEVDRSGQTASGAPLHMRPDWLARTSSKDLIVDLDGTAPPEEIDRILKKAGIYLSPCSSPALEALAEVTAVVGHVGAAIATEGDAPQAFRVGDGDDGEPVEVWMGSKAEILSPPAVICALPAALAPALGDGAQVEELEAALAAAQAQVDTLATIQQALDEAEARLSTQARSLEAAEGLAREVGRLEAEIGRLTRGAAADGAAQARLGELEAEYAAVRAELAERRVDDRRHALLKERFEAARAELVAEVHQLREQLRALGEPGLDARAVVAERDAARQAFEVLTARLVPALGESLALPIPKAPPAWTPAALDAWLDATCALLTERGARPAIQITTHQVAEAPAIALPSAPAAPRAIALAPSALEARIALLQTELDAIRADRAAAEAAWTERLAAADTALADRAQLMAELQQHQGRATREHRLRLGAEDRHARLRAEVQLRDQRIGDLEAIIATHVRMEGLLTEALDAAEVARDDASSEQRALAANLRMLQAEFERVTAGRPSDRAGAERLRAAERRAADAERRLAAAEDRIARLTAERALRLGDG